MLSDFCLPGGEPGRLSGCIQDADADRLDPYVEEDLGGQRDRPTSQTTLGDGAYELQNSSSLPRILAEFFSLPEKCPFPTEA